MPLRLVAATAEDVIAINKPIEPKICELLTLERKMSEEIRASGMSLEEFLKMDIDADTPHVRNVRKLMLRIEEVARPLTPTTRRREELIGALEAPERALVDRYMQDLSRRCAELDRLQQGAERGEANAQFELGLRYQRGEVVPRDEGEALKWWRKSAGQGHAGAQEMLQALERKAPRPVPR